jgi:hypothetical protein
MNSKQVYLYGMIVNSLITAMGMQAENQSVSKLGIVVHNKEDFDKIIVDNGIHHNAMMVELEECWND